MNTFIIIAFIIVALLLLIVIFQLDQQDDRLEHLEDDVADLDPENFPLRREKSNEAFGVRLPAED